MPSEYIEWSDMWGDSPSSLLPKEIMMNDQGNMVNDSSLHLIYLSYMQWF